MSDDKPSIKEIAKIYGKDLQDYKEMHSLFQQFKSEVIRQAEHLKKNSGARYIKKDEHSAAYSYVLEHNGTPTEALEYACEVFNQDDGWVDDIKNSPTLFSRDVVKEHDKHPVQRKMARQKVFERASLTAARTPMQQLGRLSVFRTIFEELENLRQSDKEHSKRITKLEAQQILNEEEIHRLHNKEQQMTTEERVLLLKDSGCTDAVCAEAIGITERTVRKHKKALTLIKYPTEKAEEIL